MEKPEILFLEPVMKEMVWGGNLLKSVFGYAIPSDKTGECWAVSAHENGDCIIGRGAFKGQSLSTLWRENRELFGGMPGDRFPLLVKIIDAKEDLSIQVHPDDSYAAAHENGSLGKTECWYILDCAEDAQIVIGHHAGTKEELASMMDNGKWDELIRKVPVKKGDLLQIEPGTVHAIKGGTLILETQQNSDITYRLYDYDRLQNGVKRELHMEKCKDVIKVPFSEEGQPEAEQIAEGITRLVSCPYYTVEKLTVDKTLKLTQDKPFLIMSVIEGEGTVDGQKVKKGMHFILPCGYGDVVLEGSMEILSSYS